MLNPLANPRWEQFAKGLAQGKSQTQAYKDAGFGKSTGAPARLAKNPKIVARRAELLRAQDGKIELDLRVAIQKTGVTKAWVMAMLRENVERAMQKVQVLDKKGNPIGEWRYDGFTANRALELLGRELGMFIEKKEVSFEHRVREMTPDQKSQHATQLRLQADEILARVAARNATEGDGNVTEAEYVEVPPGSEEAAQ